MLTAGNIKYEIAERTRATAACGDCLEHPELVRNDEAYFDALAARRIPAPRPPEISADASRNTTSKRCSMYSSVCWINCDNRFAVDIFPLKPTSGRVGTAATLNRTKR